MMSSGSNEPAGCDDTFKILLASDIHLGFAENDAQREMDGFNSFEEILQLAVKNKVDFLLLGGDLFHESKPSIMCLNKCLTLLRKYCLDDKPISVEFLSDQAENFRHCENLVVNYEDPNINVSIPVFSIHGNHDDPSGHNQLSSLDLLSTSGLINYFGKWTDLTEIHINPILLKKGKSKLAIYGLSYIKEERLSRLFRDQKVHMYRPNIDTDEWFNIFVCHQNRVDRGINKHLPEEVLPNFLDLVMWGHEHECRIEPEKNSLQLFDVVQPGSSIVTSLCEGESKTKFVGLLEVKKKFYRLKPLKLNTVRPFVFHDIILSQCNLPSTNNDDVQNYIGERVKMCIEESKTQLTGHTKQPKLPLIRIRIHYQNEMHGFNRIRFGQKFQTEVANPTDMIILKKEKQNIQRKNKYKNDDEKDLINNLLHQEDDNDMWEVKMNTIIQQFFSKIPKAKQLRVLSSKQISEAVSCFIDKQDKDAIAELIKNQIKKTENHFDENTDITTNDHIDEAIENYYITK